MIFRLRSCRRLWLRLVRVRGRMGTAQKEAFVAREPMLKDIPAERRVCMAEFHLELLRTQGSGGWDSFCGRSLEEFVDFAAETGIEIWYTSLPKGGPFSQLLHQEGEDATPADLIDRFVKRAHEHGILVVSAFKMNAWTSLGKLHPDWLIRNIDDGRDVPPNERFVCHNSPFGEWLADYLSDHVARHDLDGVWFDDCNFGSREAWPWPWPAGCLCDGCAEKYRQQTGRELPQRVDFSSKDFKLWVNWRYDNLRQFQLLLTQRVRAMREGAIVRFNSYPRPPLGWECANELAPITGDMQFFTETETNAIGPTLTAKLARARGDCEIWMWAIQLAGPLSALGPAPHQDPVQLAMPALAALANGVKIQSAVDYLHPEQSKFTYDELKKRRDYIGGESIRQCALHVSQQTNDSAYTRLKQPEDVPIIKRDTGEPAQWLGRLDYWRQWTGVAEMMEQTHIIYDVMFDASLTDEALAGYRVLVLPNSVCLSADQCAAIGRWVDAGGTLIATYETSLGNELGERRDDFGLADVFGAHWRGTYDGDGKSGTIYMPQDELRDRYGMWLGFSGQHTEITLADDDAQVLYTLSARRRFTTPGGRHGVDPNSSAYDSTHPGVVLHRYGKGQSIYVSGDIGEGFANWPVLVCRRFFADLIERGAMMIQVEAPSRILATAFRVDGKTINVHLYHRFSHMQHFDNSEPGGAGDWAHQWALLDEPFPVHDIKIHFNDARIKRARMPLQNAELEVDDSTIAVPPVYLHEVVQVTCD